MKLKDLKLKEFLKNKKNDLSYYLIWDNGLSAGIASLFASTPIIFFKENAARNTQQNLFNDAYNNALTDPNIQSKINEIFSNYNVSNWDSYQAMVAEYSKEGMTPPMEYFNLQADITPILNSVSDTAHSLVSNYDFFTSFVNDIYIIAIVGLVAISLPYVYKKAVNFNDNRYNKKGKAEKSKEILDKFEYK